MAINIIDHDIARRYLSRALDAVGMARAILRDTRTTDEVRASMTAAESKVSDARATVSRLMRAQAEEPTP